MRKNINVKDLNLYLVGKNCLKKPDLSFDKSTNINFENVLMTDESSFFAAYEIIDRFSQVTRIK